MTTFNFSRGHPNKDLVPLQEIRQLMAQLGSSEISHDEEEAIQKSLNYGDDAGNDSTLQQLAYFLERQCTNDQHVVAEGQARCDMNGLFITGGVSHGIDLLCAIATQPGDVIWVEEPSYFLSFGIFRSHRLQIETFPMYSPGVIDIDALEEELNSGSRPVPRVMYIIPTHQNPTGQTMPQKQRKRLANIVNRFKILLIADEVYHLLDYNRKLSAQKRPARMALFNEAVFDDIGDHTDNTLVGCCSVSGFTKIFGPGVRLGWIEGPQSIINALRRHGYIISQGGVAPFLGNVFCIALQQRVCDNVLNRLCHAYAHRVELLMGILKEETRWMIPCRPSGGFFLWLVLPFEARAFLEYCRPQVSFILGTDCSARSGNKNVFMQDELARSLRLCFAYLALEDLLAGARLLQSKFKQFLNDAQP
jgi:DNA-binding transcriptional MocR family regulator